VPYPVSSSGQFALQSCQRHVATRHSIRRLLGRTQGRVSTTGNEVCRREKRVYRVTNYTCRAAELSMSMLCSSLYLVLRRAKKGGCSGNGRGRWKPRMWLAWRFGMGMLLHVISKGSVWVQSVYP